MLQVDLLFFIPFDQMSDIKYQSRTEREQYNVSDKIYGVRQLSKKEDVAYSLENEGAVW